MNEKTFTQRAEELLSKLSLEEKLYQLSSQMLYTVREDYEQQRDPMQGNYRNPGHFMHADRRIISGRVPIIVITLSFCIFFSLSFNFILQENMYPVFPGQIFRSPTLLSPCHSRPSFQCCEYILWEYPQPLIFHRLQNIQ